MQKYFAAVLHFNPCLDTYNRGATCIESNVLFPGVGWMLKSDGVTFAVVQITVLRFGRTFRTFNHAQKKSLCVASFLNITNHFFKHSFLRLTRGFESSFANYFVHKLRRFRVPGLSSTTQSLHIRHIMHQVMNLCPSKVFFIFKVSGLQTQSGAHKELQLEHSCVMNSCILQQQINCVKLNIRKRPTFQAK